jgi:hypothetical protein
MCRNHEPGCRCHNAVMKGYTGMKLSGAAEAEALDAACRIYYFHHPEQAMEAAKLTVEQWVYAGRHH